MLPLTFQNLRTVLLLGCHSDDIEIGCGGLVLRLLRDNPRLKIHWVVLAAEGPRESEARASAAAWLRDAEACEVTIQDFRDSYFPAQWGDIKDFFHALAGQLQPDLVLTHRREDAHQDHRVASELTWCAFRDHAILEYEIPKYEGDLGQPNLYAPLDAATARRKIDLLMQHFATQRSKAWFRPETFDSLMRLRGIECKAPDGYAEAFHAPKLVL